MQVKGQHPVVSKKIIQIKELKNSDTNNPKFEITNLAAHKKSPQKVRNNVRIAKLKRAHRMTNPQHLDNQLMNIEYLREKEKKLMLNTRQIFTYFPTYTTIMDKAQVKEIGDEIFFFQDQQQFKNKKISHIKDEERIIYERKKLAPIKKSHQIETKFIEKKRSTNVSFLNVEKVPLLPVYVQTVDDKDKMAITSTFLNKKGIFLARQSFDEQTRTIQGSLGSTTQGFFKPESIPKLSRNKPFIIPFERYYYNDFVWKVGFSNKIKIQFVESYPKKFKAFVGSGNNSMLLKTLLKRRQAWWCITDRIQEAHFIWTQIKVNNVFAGQGKAQPFHEHIPKLGQQSEKKKKTILQKWNEKIMNEMDMKKWMNYYNKYKELEEKIQPTFAKRNKMLKNCHHALVLNYEKVKIHNHLPQNYMLGNKKALFYTMSQYYRALNEQIFQHIPLTFHIQNGLDDNEYLNFLKVFYEKAKSSKKTQSPDFKGRKIRNIWIIKPGEFTNRGNGIRVCLQLDQIKKIIKKKQRYENGNPKTFIIQAYIDRPFLYYRRKFDIRHFMMITSVNGHLKGYWYETGYIRTTSYEYTVKNSFNSVHLTNDAVQKNLPDYGRFEKANKITYDELEKYLKRQFNGKYSFFKTIYPQMKKIALDSMRASSKLIDPERKAHNFQIFGFDFMIDSDFHPWLIQINTNPCLQLSCPILLDIIPAMIQNAIKIGLDGLIPPPTSFLQKRAKFNGNFLEQNKFELLFDSSLEDRVLESLMNGESQMKLDCRELEKDVDEVYEDDGVELDD